MKRCLRGLLQFLLLTAVLPFISRADLYDTAFFSAQISSLGGSPSDFGLSLGDAISGRFVFDLQLIPAAGSGVQSVPFSAMPDIGTIPKPIAFDMTFGSLQLDLGNLVAGSGAIQYNDGQFAGFDVQFDFTLKGTEYRFEEHGAQFDIEQLSNGQSTGDFVVSGVLDIGENSLGKIQPFDLTSLPGNGWGDGSGGSGGDSPTGNDPPPVPEPGMFWIIAVAAASLVPLQRFKRAVRAPTRS